MGLRGRNGYNTKGVNVTTFGPTPLSNTTKCTYWNCNDLYTTWCRQPPGLQPTIWHKTHQFSGSWLSWHTNFIYRKYLSRIWSTNIRYIAEKSVLIVTKKRMHYCITSYDEIKANQLLYGRYPALTCLATFSCQSHKESKLTLKIFQMQLE